MRDYEKETIQRIAFIQDCLKESGAKGIVYGNSGGKDSALVSILCKMACDNTKGIIMPCGSRRNYDEDQKDALYVAKQYNIETCVADLSGTRIEMFDILRDICTPTKEAKINLVPRLRMSLLYAFAASENRLVAGSGNRSEFYMGYFTKWGDGAYDFNPIADLSVHEIYDYLKYLKAPSFLWEKAPSAGLYDLQSDEMEMGVTYASIDIYMEGGTIPKAEEDIIKRYHQGSEHKRHMPRCYKGGNIS